MAREISGRGTKRKADRRDAAGGQDRIGEMANADSKIKAFFDQIDVRSFNTMSIATSGYCAM